MIAVYIILGIILFFAIILSLHAGLLFKLEDKKFNLFLKIGPVKIRLMPKKKKKTSYKKLAKKLRGKKLSTYSPKKKDYSKKDKSYSKTINSLLKTISDNTDNADESTLGFETLKALVLYFKQGIKTEFTHCIIEVDEKDSAKTCIRASLISQGVAYITEFLNVHTLYTPPKEGRIAVVPVFDNSGYKFLISGRFRIRIFTFIKNVLTLVFKNIFK